MNKVKACLWIVLFIFLHLLMTVMQAVIVPIATICALFGRGKVQQWGVNCWEGEDNKTSAQLGGDPDDSLSSRLGKARRLGSGWGVVADGVDLVAEEFFNDVNHCDKNIERANERKKITRH